MWVEKTVTSTHMDTCVVFIQFTTNKTKEPNVVMNLNSPQRNDNRS